MQREVYPNDIMVMPYIIYVLMVIYRIQYVVLIVHKDCGDVGLELVQTHARFDLSCNLQMCVICVCNLSMDVLHRSYVLLMLLNS
jgi:hypothetical protein